MRHSLLTVPVTLGVLAGSSMSAVIVVDQGGGGDWMTIGEAVAAASSGDEIEIVAGTYTELVDLSGTDLQLRQQTSADVVVIDGEDVRRCLVCTSGESSSTTFTGLTFANGSTPDYGGCIWIDDASPVFTNCTITGGNAIHGAGVFVTGSLASPDFNSVTIESCTASQRGGGLSALQSTVTMIDCTIQDNIAGTLSGGMTIENQAVLSMSDSFVLNNELGGIGFLTAGVSSIDSTTVSGNDSIEGGGLRISSSDVQVTGCVISNNDATRGGGIQVGSSVSNGAVLTLTSCILMENRASTSGGGVYVVEAFGSSTNETVTIDMCTFSDNSAGEASAALGNAATDSVTIQATTFCDHWYAEEILGNWVEVGDSNEFGQWCCGGDIDGDGDVDTSDLQTFLLAFGVGFIAENDREDVSRDGDADVEDLILLLAEWGSCS